VSNLYEEFYADIAEALGMDRSTPISAVRGEFYALVALRDEGDPVTRCDPSPGRRELLLLAVCGVNWTEARERAARLLERPVEAIQADAVAELGADLWGDE